MPKETEKKPDPFKEKASTDPTADNDPIRCKATVAIEDMIPTLEKEGLGADSVKTLCEPEDFFYCHFCKLKTKNMMEHEKHLLEDTHNENIELRKKSLESFTEEFYTAVHSLGQYFTWKNTPYTLCGRCLMPYSSRWGGHARKPEHLIGQNLVHPTCHVCVKPFYYFHDLEKHVVTLEHIRERLFKDPKTHISSDLGDEEVTEYTGDVPLGTHFVRPVTAIYCEACKEYLPAEGRRHVKMEEHCALDSHVENVRAFAETYNEGVKKRQAERREQDEAQAKEHSAKRIKFVKAEDGIEDEKVEKEDDAGEDDGDKDENMDNEGENEGE